MRILHLLSQTELTGAEVYAQQLVQSQLKLGHEVHLISDKMHVPLPIPWTSLPLARPNIFRRLKNARILRRYLLEHRIDVVHCHSRAAVRHMAWARRGLKVGMVSTLHGRQHFSWSKRLFNLYGEMQIAVCENVKSAFIRDFRWPGSPIQVIRNPMNIAASNATLQPKVDQPTSSGLHIALIGRSTGPKGRRFEEIVNRCFAKWLHEDTTLKFSIIVPSLDGFSDVFQSMVMQLNSIYGHRIQLTGEVGNLASKLTCFDLVLGSGRVAIESVLARVPLFAIGEHSAPGILTKENLSECLASNFGDMGAIDLEETLDIKVIDQEISSFLQGKRPNEAELAALHEIATEEFDGEQIAAQVLEVYRGAIFKRHVPSWIPILMYHKVPHQPLATRHRIFVTKDRFERHLRFFSNQGFQTLRFADILPYWRLEKPYSTFPKKPLILTFDDGYKDTKENAEPLLKKYGFSAVVYLLGNHDIIENQWDAKDGEPSAALMTIEEKKTLDSKVWEVASHGYNHVHLTDVDESKAYDEMSYSREKLEQDLGQPILSFAYPYGSTAPHLQKLARRAGYQFAVNTDQGGLHMADNQLGLFRVNVFPEDGEWQLRKKTSSWYRKYFYRKRGR